MNYEFIPEEDLWDTERGSMNFEQIAEQTLERFRNEDLRSESVRKVIAAAIAADVLFETVTKEKLTGS